MTITFPRDLPFSGEFTEACSFDLVYQQTTSIDGGGSPNVADVGPAMWKFDASTVARTRAAYGTWDAWLLSLRGGLKTFKGRPPLWKWPQNYPKGFTGLLVGGVQWTGLGNLFQIKDTLDQVKINGLPVGLSLKEGDLFSIPVGSRQNLHRIVEAAVADSTGAVVLTVEPTIRPNAVPGVSVMFEAPYCDMVLIGPVTKSRQGAKGGMFSFTAQQVLSGSDPVTTLSNAAQAVTFEADAIAINGADWSMVVKDSITPANNYSGTIDGKLLNSRTGNAMFIGSNGLLQTAGPGVVRRQYDPITLASLGILREVAATNICLQSQTANNAAWALTGLKAFGSGSVADTIAAPDGTTTADFICEDTSTAPHQIIQSITIAANTTYTASTWLKAGARTKGRFIWNNSGATSGIIADFDLGAGTIGAPSGIGTGTAVSSRIRAYANGWYRLSLVGIIDASSTIGDIRIGLRDGSGNVSYTGDGASGLYMWGAQVETGLVATSYIPTTTGSAARVADNLTLANTAYSLDPGNVSMFGTMQLFKVASGSQRFAELGSIGVDGPVLYATVSGGAAQAQVFSGSAAQMVVALGTPSDDVDFKAGLTYKANDGAADSSLAAIGTDASIAVPASLASGLLVGGAATGLIKELIVYTRRRMSNAELTAYTG